MCPQVLLQPFPQEQKASSPPLPWELDCTHASFVFFCFWPSGTWDLNFWTRDQTRASLQEKYRVLITGPPGKSLQVCLLLTAEPGGGHRLFLLRPAGEVSLASPLFCLRPLTLGDASYHVGTLECPMESYVART